MNGRWWLPLRSCVKGNGKTTWNLISFLAQNLQSHNRTSYLRDDHFFMSGISKVRIWVVHWLGRMIISAVHKTAPLDPVSYWKTNSFTCLHPLCLTYILLPPSPLFLIFFKVKTVPNFLQNKFRNLHRKGGCEFILF
jgi:hypothetical protein